MDNLLNLPADAPAYTAWRCLWAMGIDVCHPTDTRQTAHDWLASLELSDSFLKKIYRTATEAQEGKTA